MKCPICQLENPEEMNFCGHCGNPLPVRCPECGHDNPLGAESCNFCGATLPIPSLPGNLKPPSTDYTPLFLKQEILRVPGSIEGERKMVSVLFADVAGFTSMSEDLDPEDVHEIMDGCFDILGREIHGAGGSINQYTGDGVMALFGAPQATLQAAWGPRSLAPQFWALLGSFKKSAPELKYTRLRCPLYQEPSATPTKSYSSAPVMRTGTIRPTGSSPSTSTNPSISGASR